MTQSASTLQPEQTWQQAILDSADFTIISTDPKGVIQTLNAGALRKLGYESEEIIGKVTPAILHDPQEVKQKALQLSQELGHPIEPGFEVFVAKARLGITDENTWTYIRKDRSRFPVRLSVTALHDQAGHLTGFLGVGKDITHQQQAERSFRESEARFSEVFRHAAIGMALVSPEGHWIKVNASLCKLVGYSQQELLALTFQDITHRDDLTLDLNEVEQLLAGEIDSYDIEKRYVHKQGHEVWVLLSVSLVRGDHDQPLYFIAQIQDVSQRKQAEAILRRSNAGLEQLVYDRTAQLEQAYQKLKLSEATYQDLYDNSPDMHVSVDADTAKVVQCNQRLCDALGFSKDEILDRPIFDLYHPDCHPEAKIAFQTFAQTGEVQDAQLQLRRQDGSKLEVSLNVQAVRDQEGNILHSRSSWRDVTERKRLEAQLQQVNAELEQRVQERTQQLEVANQSLQHSQERLELALAASGNAWWHWNIVTDEHEWSPQLSTMLGYAEGELKASTFTWESLVHPDDLPRVIEQRMAHFNDESVSYCLDYRMRSRSGDWKWIANLGKVVERDQQGQPVRIAGMKYDISDRKQAEEQLRQLNRELQRSNQELDQFAYVASHDLQEPLRMVKSFTELLAQRYQNQLDDQAERYMSFITDGAIRMQALISDLLAYSQVGRFEMAVQPTPLGEIVAQVQSDLQQVVQDRKAKIEVESLPIIFADPTQIRQLMQNLLVNAIKYCQADIPVVQIRATSTDENWIISVQDNGIGIDPQFAERIFVIFQRLHNKDTYSGTGIGLAICKKIVERHQGMIWVASQEGQGSTFSFQLPKHAQRSEHLAVKLE
jgi:PAS domain S-box-containing protein